MFQMISLLDKQSGSGSGTISLCVPAVIFCSPLNNTDLVVKTKVPDVISGIGEPSDKVCGVAAPPSIESDL